MRNRNIWFSSDYHLGHFRMMVFACRPFNSVLEMDEAIIESHNSKVKENDIFYFLGDLCMDKRLVPKVLPKLNGKWHFILGNHDKAKLNIYKEFCPVVEKQMTISIDGKFLFLNHYEMACWDRSHFGTWHLFGHYHSKSKKSLAVGKKHNVAWDVNNYSPLHIDEIKEIMKNKPNNWDLLQKK